MNNTFGSYNKFGSLKVLESVLAGKHYNGKVCRFLNNVCVYFKEIESIKNKTIKCNIAQLYMKDRVSAFGRLINFLEQKYYEDFNFNESEILKSHGICFIKSKYKEVDREYTTSKKNNIVWRKL